MSLTVLSENVPLAVNCWTAPFAIAPEAGDTAMEMRSRLTASSVDPFISPIAAEMAAVPITVPAAIPDGSIFATLTSDELHVANQVMSFSVLSG